MLPLISGGGWGTPCHILCKNVHMNVCPTGCQSFDTQLDVFVDQGASFSVIRFEIVISVASFEFELNLHLSKL